MTEEHQPYKPLKLPGSNEFLQMVKSMREGAHAGRKLRHDWLASINPQKLN